MTHLKEACEPSKITCKHVYVCVYVCVYTCGFFFFFEKGLKLQIIKWPISH